MSRNISILLQDHHQTEWRWPVWWWFCNKIEISQLILVLFSSVSWVSRCYSLNYVLFFITSIRLNCWCIFQLYITDITVKYGYMICTPHTCIVQSGELKKTIVGLKQESLKENDVQMPDTRTVSCVNRLRIGLNRYSAQRPRRGNLLAGETNFIVSKMRLRESSILKLLKKFHCVKR